MNEVSTICSRSSMKGVTICCVNRVHARFRVKHGNAQEQQTDGEDTLCRPFGTRQLAREDVRGLRQTRSVVERRHETKGERVQY